MADSKVIAHRLVELRNKAKKTGEEVCKACEISRSALTMYEIGERIPRDEIKVKLARYYDTTVEAIFFTD